MEEAEGKGKSLLKEDAVAILSLAQIRLTQARGGSRMTQQLYREDKREEENEGGLPHEL